MNIKTASAIAALLLIVGIQNADARNPSKGGGGGSVPTNPVLFGAFSAQCNANNSQASASFQNISGNETVQLSVKKNAVAATNVQGLNSVNYTMLGGINFNVTGASINNNNFVVTVFFTAPGDNVITPRYCTFADGGIQQGGSSTAYFIGVNHRNGNTQIPAGSRINGIQVQLKNFNGNATNNISNLTFTAFPGAGYDLTSPSAFCSGL